MKKFVVLSLISFLILAFGAVVYGQEKAPVMEFKASGFISIESHYSMNSTYPGSGDTNQDNFIGPAVSSSFRPGGVAFDKTEAYWEQRGRLKFDAILGKEMTGTFQFEFDSTRWGERSPLVTGTTSAAAQRGAIGVWDADRAALEVKQLYMTFGMPWIPVPTTIQAGIVPIGVRPRVVFANDGPGIIGTIKVDPAAIRLMYFKQYEGNDYAADDDDVYGVDLNAKIQNLTAGVYAVYFKMNTYAVPTAVTSTVDSKGYVWFGGLYLDGKVGPANLTFDFALDNGKFEDHRDLPAASLAKDVKYSGWLARADLSMPWEKFVFGLVGVYGSGADAKKTGGSGQVNTVVGTGAAPYTAVTSRVGAFALTPIDNDGPGDLFVINGHPDFLRGDSGLYGAASAAMGRSLYGGLWYLKLSGAIQVTDMDKFYIGAAYIGDTTKNGNTIGNARKSSGYLRDDKSIGWEFDLLNTIQLYKNLTFDVGFGYLVAGKGVDYWTGTGTENKSPKDPWILGTRLAYSF